MGCVAHIINLAVNDYMKALKAPAAVNLEGFYDELQQMAATATFLNTAPDFETLLDKVSARNVSLTL